MAYRDAVRLYLIDIEVPYRPPVISGRRGIGFGIKPENSYGIMATIDSEDMIAARPETSFKGIIAQIPNDILRNTFSSKADINGIRSSSGKLSLRAKSGGIVNPTPDFYRALDAAFGKSGNLDIAGALTHSAIPCTVTILNMKDGDGAKFTKNNSLAIFVNGKYEVAWITDISGDVVTVEPAFSSIPSLGSPVKRSITWGPTDGVWIIDEAIGIGNSWVKIFDLDHKDVDPGTLIGKVDGISSPCSLSVGTGINGVDQIVFITAPGFNKSITANYRYANYGRSYTCEEFYGENKSITHIGLKCAGLDINVETGQLVRMDFDWLGKDFIIGTDDAPIYSYIHGVPIVGLYGKCIIGETAYAIQKFSVNLKNIVEPLTDMNSPGYENIKMTGREITGSFTLKYNNQDFLNDFANAVTPKIFVQAGSAIGNIFATRIKKAKYTDVNITNDALRKCDIPFKASYIDSADEIFVAIL